MASCLIGYGFLVGEFNTCSLRLRLVSSAHLLDLNRDLGNMPCELRLRLGSDRLDYRCAKIDANIGRLIRGKNAALGVFDPPIGDLLAVDEQCALSTFAHAAVICQFEPDRRCSGCEFLLRGNRAALKSKEIVVIGRNTILNVESPAAKTKRGHLPEPILAKLITVVVSDEQADAVFDFIYSIAHIGRPGGGILMMDRLLGTTRYVLPADVPDAKQ